MKLEPDCGPMLHLPRCQHSYEDEHRRGEQCKNPAKGRKVYCHVHEHLHEVEE